MISATKGNVAVRQRQRQPTLRTRKRVFDPGEHCYFLVTAQPAPHPDKSEWFHCTRIHIILNGLLGIPEIYY